MYKFLFSFASALFFSSIAFAETIHVPASGKYDGPLQTKPSAVVAELFSSENCPACPPADEYMKDLINSKGVIALSCHVDYFGKTSAGLGKEFCTDRQTKYIEQIKRKSHFTPQMMINGHMSEIGYETSNVAAAIVKGRSERVQAIDIQSPASNAYNFTIPQINAVKDADLLVVVYQKPKTVTRRGKTTTYYNVVKNIVDLGDWRGGPISHAFYPLTDSQSAGFAVIAQEKRSGKIIAAGEYRF